MKTFTADNHPADIVKMYPKASDLFKKHHIDFCCGGKKPLNETFQTMDLNGSAILKELNDSFAVWTDANEQPPSIDYEGLSSSDLINHIVGKHHVYLRQELDPLTAYVDKVYQVHGPRHAHLTKLHTLFHELKRELLEHTSNEEANDFPLIEAYEANPVESLLLQIRAANSELETEHETTGNILKELRQITNDYTPPEDACNTYRMTYKRLEELETDTYQHVHLENNILFPRYA